MKKVLAHLFVCAGVLSVLVGCSTIAQSYGKVEVKYPEMYATIDVDTNNKITATTTTVYLFGLLRVSGGNKFAEVPGIEGSMFGWRGTRSRSSAVYVALHNNNCDLIVDPNFRTVKRIGFLHLFESYKTTMTGYGAKVTSLSFMGDAPHEAREPMAFTGPREATPLGKDMRHNGVGEKKPSERIERAQENQPRSEVDIPVSSKSVKSETPESNIFSLFESGKINDLSEKEKKVAEASFMKEIEDEIKNARSVEDCDVIRQKIQALQSYNKALKRPKQSIVNWLSFYTSRFKGIEKKIQKK